VARVEALLPPHLLDDIPSALNVMCQKEYQWHKRFAQIFGGLLELRRNSGACRRFPCVSLFLNSYMSSYL
jgi:hypothetical protein